MINLFKYKIKYQKKPHLNISRFKNLNIIMKINLNINYATQLTKI